MEHYTAAIAVKIIEFDLQNYLFLHTYVVETLDFNKQTLF